MNFHKIFVLEQDLIKGKVSRLKKEKYIELITGIKNIIDECSLKSLQTADFYHFHLSPKGELLKISSLKKSPLGDLGVIRLFRLDSLINNLLRDKR